jgi:hypothetical protein
MITLPLARGSKDAGARERGSHQLANHRVVEIVRALQHNVARDLAGAFETLVRIRKIRAHEKEKAHIARIERQREDRVAAAVRPRKADRKGVVVVVDEDIGSSVTDAHLRERSARHRCDGRIICSDEGLELFSGRGHDWRVELAEPSATPSPGNPVRLSRTILRIEQGAMTNLE